MIIRSYIKRAPVLCIRAARSENPQFAQHTHAYGHRGHHAWWPDSCIPHRPGGLRYRRDQANDGASDASGAPNGVACRMMQPAWRRGR